MQENKEAIEYMMSVVDEAERALSQDPLAERIPVTEYSLEFPKTELDPMSCMECPLWQKRAGVEEYINFDNPKVLSVIGFREMGRAILQSDAMTMYEAQMMKVLGLQRSQRALVSLIKCPTDHFEHAEADKCKAFLREEMEKWHPEAMILFGTDISRYMTRQTKVPFEALCASVHKKPFMINGIPTYVTYSQRECLMNPSLKAQVFADLKTIKAALS